MSEIEQLEQAIAALEAQRAVLGEAVVETALAPLKEKLASLRSELAVPEQSLGEQRKLVTVLFADLAGFTAMSEQLDPEDVREILAAYFSRWTAAIERYGGVVEKFIGDAVMAVFGLRIAREDDPENAIRAALEMRQSLEALNQELERKRSLQLAMRVGIHTGPVVVSLLGERKGQDFVVVGDTVNLASRLQAAAPVSGPLISHDTYRHVRGIFSVQALEAIQVKGKSELIQVYLVQQAKPRAFRTSTRGVEGIETRMIGRQAELKRLQMALSAAIQDGERHAITLIGDPGMGKSRLIDEFDNWVELLPEEIFYFKGRASPAMQNQAYSLLRDLFSYRFQIQDSDPPDVVREKMERGIGEALAAHLIGQLLGFDVGDSPDLPQTPEDPARKADFARQLRDRALVSIGDYFRAVALESPVVILLEDIHWADDSSLDALGTLSIALEQQPVLIVCAARPTLFERRPQWGEGQPFQVRLDLQPLSHQESRQLVAEILQKVADLPEALRELVVNNAEGNPFYIEELIKMLIEDEVILKGAAGEQPDDERWRVDLLRLSGTRVPPTLTGVLQARFDSLALEERLLLQRAAVIGRTFWDRAVTFLGEQERDEKDITADATQGVLRKLRGREMVFQRPSSTFEEAREFFFKHSLMRDVTYESVLRRRRQFYHARSARWLVVVTQHSRRVDQYAALIAEHFDLAGEVELAGYWYERAGTQAAAHFANAEAVRLFGRALDLAPEQEIIRRCDLLLAREKVYGLLGDRPAQLQDLEALKALVDQQVGLERADRRRAELHLRWSGYYESTGNYPAAVADAQRANELAQLAGDPAIETRALISEGSAHWRSANYADARDRFERALALARQSGLRGQEADSLRNLGVVGDTEGDYYQAQHYFEQAQIIYHEIGDRRGESMCLNSLGVVVYHLNEFAKARDYYERSLLLKHDFGDRYGEGISLTNLGIVARQQGDPVAAEKYFDKGLTLCRAIEDLEGQASALNGLGSVSIYWGDFPNALIYNELALKICQQIGDRQGECGVLASLSQLHRYLGENEAARDYSQRAVKIAQETGSLSELGYALFYLGNAQLRLDSPDEAVAAYQRSLQIRQEIGQDPLAYDSLAGLARVAQAKGDHDLARRYAAEILDYLRKDHGAELDEPFLAYLTCYRVLQAGQDPHAPAVLEAAYRRLQDLAARITDEGRRRSFLENVPDHREIVALWGSRR
jgi:class 3 adenylate cyclase/Tfp pilus assembly protein PilF